MHYGIIGLGPVGATFGGLLAAAGHRVSFLDNNVHRVEVFEKKPLKISGHYNAEIKLTDLFTEFKAFADSEPEVVLISVKTHTLRDILDRIKHSNLRSKAIVSCQNGIDTEKEIAAALGDDHAFRMILNFGVSYKASNEVAVNFVNEPHFISAVSSNSRFIAQKIVTEMKAVGVHFEYTEDITKEAFRKAILNTTLSTICTLTRMTMAEVMSEFELVQVVREMLSESKKVSELSGITLGDDFVDKAVAYLSKGGNHKPSMLVDIEQERQTEIRHLAGKLYEYAKKKDVAIPVTQTMFYLVKSLEKSVMLRKYINIPHE